MHKNKSYEGKAKKEGKPSVATAEESKREHLQRLHPHIFPWSAMEEPHSTDETNETVMSNGDYLLPFTASIDHVVP